MLLRSIDREIVMLKWTALIIDWNAVATGAAALGATALLLALLLFCGAWRRERQRLGADLARIFEQLDLLRFDGQQAGVGVAAPVPAAAVAAAAERPAAALRLAATNLDSGDYHAAARLAARGSTVAEIAERCGLVSGEARVLVALQQARARRAGTA
jgi:hypothetical protein